MSEIISENSQANLLSACNFSANFLHMRPRFRPPSAQLSCVAAPPSVCAGDLNPVREAVFGAWLAGMCTRRAVAAGEPCSPRCAPSGADHLQYGIALAQSPPDAIGPSQPAARQQCVSVQQRKAQQWPAGVRTHMVVAALIPPSAAKNAGGELDWPVNAQRTLERFSSAYDAATTDDALEPAHRIAALNRLGMVMQSGGRLEERAALVRRALELKEGMLGAESTQLTHEARLYSLFPCVVKKRLSAPSCKLRVAWIVISFFS